MLDLFKSEPAVMTTAIAGVVDALLMVAVAFGVHVTPDQKVAVDTAIESVMTLITVIAAGVVIRSQVTPTAKS